jgi:GNAT superfamily N-acetyltransferase
VPAGLTRAQATAALEHNLWGMWAQFGLADGCRLVDEPDLLRFETPLACVPYNSVMRFRADGNGVDDRIDEVLAAYDTRAVPLMWVLHPSARPGDLDRRLAARGLVEAEVVPGMVRRLDDLPAPGAPPVGVEVEEVGPDSRDPYVELLTWRYALPPAAGATLRSVMDTGRFGEPGSPNRSWYARRDGVVVSKVSLHHHDGVAGVYGLATRPEARGLGLGTVLTLRALAAARASGAELGILHSTPMAVGLYAALGFEAVADFRLWARPDTLHL